MTPQEQFDDLVRRKLEERSFPFNEAHWEQAQEAIAARKRGRRGGYWVGALILLLGTGIAAWWAWPQAAQQAAPNPAHERSATTAAEGREAQHTPADATVMVDLDLGPNGSADGPVHSTNGRPADDAVAASVARPPVQPPASTGTLEAHETPSRSEVRPTVRPATASAASSPALTTAATQETAETSRATMLGQQGEVIQQRIGTATSAGVSDAEPRPGAPRRSTDDPAKDLHQRSDAGENPDNPNVQAEMPEHRVQAAESHTTEPATVQPPAIDADQSEEAAQPSEADTTANRPAMEAAVGDSIAADATSIDPALLTLPRKPWELGLVAGPFNSDARYTGDGSAAIQEATGPMRTHMAGIELMHMGRRLGIGTGLYHGTHAERARFDAVERTVTSVDHYWYLLPVDTSILVITDTVLINGQPHYEGHQVPTTIQVITQGADTTTSTQALRNARTIVNRTSYLEIPLLLDVHLVQGRWTLGLRGGPTLGLLTKHRVTLPLDDDTGYAELGSEAFRSMVAGYTARAYIRYRWNAAWSVGIEPTLRGQWMNSLSEGLLERRARATGVMMSLTYRLR